MYMAYCEAVIAVIKAIVTELSIRMLEECRYNYVEYIGSKLVNKELYE